MFKTMCLNRSEELAAKLGFKPAPPDHPIYSEGSTIMFLSKSTKSFKQKIPSSSHKGSCKNTSSKNINPIEKI